MLTAAQNKPHTLIIHNSPLTLPKWKCLFQTTSSVTVVLNFSLHYSSPSSIIYQVWEYVTLIVRCPYFEFVLITFLVCTALRHFLLWVISDFKCYLSDWKQTNDKSNQKCNSQVCHPIWLINFVWSMCTSQCESHWGNGYCNIAQIELSESPSTPIHFLISDSLIYIRSTFSVGNVDSNIAQIELSESPSTPIHFIIRMPNIHDKKHISTIYNVRKHPHKTSVSCGFVPLFLQGIHTNWSITWILTLYLVHTVHL